MYWEYKNTVANKTITTYNYVKASVSIENK
jgi:hypothetical protein